MKLSVCVVTLNEERNITRCLASCQAVADELLVVDSGSTDGTIACAQRLGARVVHQDWLGFVGQKNHAVALARHDWILNLDADEALSPALQAAVAAWKQSPAPGVVGFSIPRCVLYQGRWIRHGDWYPDRLIRLFDRRAGRFTGMEPHAYVRLDGPVQRWRADIEHYAFRDPAEHWERCQKYAKIWARMKHAAGRRAGPLTPVLRAALRWFRAYVIRAGFLDGQQGWRIAAITAREVRLKYQLLRELG